MHAIAYVTICRNGARARAAIFAENLKGILARDALVHFFIRWVVILSICVAIDEHGEGAALICTVVTIVGVVAVVTTADGVVDPFRAVEKNQLRNEVGNRVMSAAEQRSSDDTAKRNLRIKRVDQIHDSIRTFLDISCQTVAAKILSGGDYLVRSSFPRVLFLMF